MNALLAVCWQFLRGVLPYPDLRRRWRVRRRALKLVTCEDWPGENATGLDAAQLALLRLVWLQRLTRNAVVERRAEDAAMLARAALETCIVGLYCVHSGDPIAHLSAASHRSAGRVVSYLSDADLGSKAAMDGAVQALSELGPEVNVRDLALWLEREHELVIAAKLYHSYYVPLSHLFTRSYGFALMRHVEPDGRIRRKPAFPWLRRSAVRMADGCVGVLAANIADKSGIPSALFLRYATDHLDRLMTPALAFTVKGALRSVPWYRYPRTFRAIIEAQRDASGLDRDDESVRQDARRSETPGAPFEPGQDFEPPAGTDFGFGVRSVFKPPLGEDFEPPADRAFEPPVRDVFQPPMDEVIEPRIRDAFEAPVGEVFDSDVFKPPGEGFESPGRDAFEPQPQDIFQSPVPFGFETRLGEVFESQRSDAPDGTFIQPMAEYFDEMTSQEEEERPARRRGLGKS